jgi:hypothetical protein
MERRRDSDVILWFYYGTTDDDFFPLITKNYIPDDDICCLRLDRERNIWLGLVRLLFTRCDRSRSGPLPRGRKR